MPARLDPEFVIVQLLVRMCIKAENVFGAAKNRLLNFARYETLWKIRVNQHEPNWSGLVKSEHKREIVAPESRLPTAKSRTVGV